MKWGARLVAALLLALIIFGIARGVEAAPLGAAAQATQQEPAPAGVDRPIGTRDPGLEARTSEIASELRCPVCQGVSVEDSPTELARQMRAVVREQLAAGRTPNEVRGYFVDKYGEWILLKPKASGFNLLVYVLPWLVLFIGVSIVVLAVRRWTRPLPEDASEPAQPVGSTLEP